MKKLLLIILLSNIGFAQVQNFGEMTINENVAFHTELINKGTINGSEILGKMEGNYFLFREINRIFISVSGDNVRVTLNGAPVIGVQGREITTLSDTETTRYLNPNIYDQIRIGAKLVKTEYWDMKGSFIGNELIGQKGIYIERSYFSDGSKSTKKVQI